MVWYRLSLKSGYRKLFFPASEYRLPDPIVTDFKFKPVHDYPYDRDSLIDHANRLCNGEMQYFSYHWGKAGDPPNWFRNPFTGQEVSDPKRHWTIIGDFEKKVGDIKFIWEPSRFNWAPILARACRVTGDAKYLRIFQKWSIDWLAKNPINAGPNWKCGQESAIRLMNLILAIHILNHDPTKFSKYAQSELKLPFKTEWLHFFIDEHLKRIKKNISYAINQQNNHATSEAAGLYIGGLFLERVFSKVKVGQSYKAFGAKCLEKLAAQLIYDDGTFSQHSLNYHRLAVDTFSIVCFWNQYFGEEEFSANFYDRYRRAIDWQYLMTDESGDGPNMGSNDGALLFHLTACDYRDFRPSLDWALFAFNGSGLAGRGKWTEAVFWTFGKSKSPAKKANLPQRKSVLFPDGGYFRFQGEDSWGVFRLANKKNHRPVHADALSVDLWYKGENILRDAGSYLYNAEPPWDGYFKSTRAHNTVEVDGRDQMVSFSRFMWLNWTEAKIRHLEIDTENDIDHIEAEHYGYGNGRKGVLHRRALLRRLDKIIIVDDLFSPFLTEFILNWRIINWKWGDSMKNVIISTDYDISIELRNSAESENKFYDSKSSKYWESMYYGEKHLSSLFCSRALTERCRWRTLINFDDNLIRIDNSDSFIAFHDELKYKLVSLDLKSPKQLVRDN